MKKIIALLPATVALMVSVSPLMPGLTSSALAGPGGRGQKMERMAQELNLTEQQKTQMRQIRESAKQQMEAVLTEQQKQQLQQARQNRQRPQLNLTEDQKSKMQAIRQETRSKMEAILTAEQKQKLQQMKQQRRQGRQQYQQPQM